MEKEYMQNGSIQKKGGLAVPAGEINEIIKMSGDAIPREPQKMKLMGHRAKVTKCVFHPFYT